MNRLSPSLARSRERGMTLIELLAAITILGVIAFALTEAIIQGLRTTEGTAANISGSIGTEAAVGWFTGDAKSADQVSSTWAGCGAEPDPGGVLLNLNWTDEGTKVVNYALEPPTGTEQTLVRWTCDGTSVTGRRQLGVFSSKESDPLPVSVSCDGVPCAASPPIAPDTITMSIRANASHPDNDVTVERRAP